MPRFNNLKDQFGMPLDEQDPMSVSNQSAENMMQNFEAKQQEDADARAPKYATGNKITPLSLIDQFTGAPTRAGISELQKGLGKENFKSAYEKALEAMSQDPSLAASGQDIAKGVGANPDTMGGKALGVGYDLALDPTNLIPSKGGLAMMGAMGKISDVSKAEKLAKEVQAVERVKGVLGGNKAREMSKVGNVERNVKSAEELVSEMNKMPKKEFGKVGVLGELKKGQPGANTLVNPDTMRSTGINNRDPLYDKAGASKEGIAEYLKSMGASPEQIMEAFKKRGL